MERLEERCMEFIETLNELATRIGLGKVELDEAGGVMLLFDGECGGFIQV